ncbi:D-arabinono-1,4-lactone oxidase [uncultured Nocardioides sp.]|uniref:D-arabinono-1,4-lactone oxidase n=1 Tax=uncultured Nocardioides sp. TaxID=198441 RepID=UPI002604D6C6|nr:D-arabinono-1,4-lactone oxidase [uncultured Nocardioides sp.]
MNRWQNWSRLETAVPRVVEHPRTPAAVVALVERARDEHRAVKMVGSGHSFTAVAAPEHTLVRPDRLTGILDVDRDAGTVEVLAGTTLHHLNGELARLGLALSNVGDIDVQTVAGAVSTGTHGAAGRVAGLAAQLVGLRMVTGTGKHLTLSTELDPQAFSHARLGLGALGILTSVTFAVEPAYRLAATERVVGWDELVGGLDDRIGAHDHVDAYWFPGTDRCLLRVNDRVAAGAPAPSRSRGRVARWVDDELVANGALGVATALTARVPALTGRVNRLVGALAGGTTYTEPSHEVFSGTRRVRFREMEYAVPLAAAPDALAAVRRIADAHRIGFPVEVRTAVAEDVPLSPAYGRDTCYVAVHVHHSAVHEPYFAEVEAALMALDGRPHWGKVHRRQAADLAPAYPLFDEFLALRDRLDPDRLFTNAYLRRVLGP